MRESFGGAFMIKMVLIFIVIYISFMAVAVNYAKAFRVKNNIINILEQSRYEAGDDATHAIIDEYLASVPYSIDNEDKKKACENSGAEYLERGVCLTQYGNTNDGYYYKVTTYISIEFPFFKLYMTFPISGETKIIS